MTKYPQSNNKAQNPESAYRKVKGSTVSGKPKRVKIGSRELAELVKSGHFKCPLEMHFEGHHIATRVPRDDGKKRE